MKTHRPWQPHMSSTPLFNPYASTTGRGTSLDRFDLAEEEQEAESSGEQSPDQVDDQPPAAERD